MRALLKEKNGSDEKSSGWHMTKLESFSQCDSLILNIIRGC